MKKAINVISLVTLLALMLLLISAMTAMAAPPSQEATAEATTQATAEATTEATAEATAEATTQAPAGGQAAATCEQDVVVQADDWLSKLADKIYGDVLAYQAIVDATNAMHETDPSYAKIDNPDVIEPGWK